MPAPAPIHRRLLRPLHTPLVWAPLTVLLMVDGSQLAEQDSTSTCGAAIRGCMEAIGCCGWSTSDWVHMPMGCAVRSADGYRFIGQRDGAPRNSDVWIAGIYHPAARRSSGFWALTHQSTTEELTVEDCPWNGLPTLTPAEESLIRSAYIGAHPELAHLAGGTVSTGRIVWPGVAHDAAAAAVGSLWLASLHGLFRSPRRRREALRVAAGQCPKCAYDLRSGGLAACPECGWGGGA